MKQHLRKEMKGRLAGMSVSEVLEKSRAACKMLTALAEFQAAQTVMLYLPVPREVDTAPAALAAWRQRKTVVVPKVDWQQRHMIAVTCDSLDDGLVTGQYGIREPARGKPWPAEQIDLVVVPALAYDVHGNRLGRGGGFYDRFLGNPMLKAVTVGLAFEAQVLDELPAGEHDMPVDILVTDTQVRRFAPAGGR